MTDDLDEVFNRWIAEARRNDKSLWSKERPIKLWRKYLSDFLYSFSYYLEKLTMWLNRHGSQVRWGGK